jgi:hypothetical protein
LFQLHFNWKAYESVDFTTAKQVSSSWDFILGRSFLQPEQPELPERKVEEFKIFTQRILPIPFLFVQIPNPTILFFNHKPLLLLLRCKTGLADKQ